ncbi:aminotransferase class V-fold PLP-dependent enzyme [Streptomyces sp. NPDC002088]|uniref:aminotransferase class V-fold PLP-dependent enzyme n=1 Tax=Streptomyces sp. NPDC002088 TaxID=3154665 RepID=UPI0033245013
MLGEEGQRGSGLVRRHLRHAQRPQDRLTARALEILQEVPSVRIVGPRDLTDRGSAVSFTVDGIHPHDVGQILDDRGVAVHVGHHCARPIVKRYGIPATTRATFYVHNTEAGVDALVDGVRAARAYFAK